MYRAASRILFTKHWNRLDSSSSVNGSMTAQPRCLQYRCLHALLGGFVEATCTTDSTLRDGRVPCMYTIYTNVHARTVTCLRNISALDQASQSLAEFCLHNVLACGALGCCRARLISSVLLFTARKHLLNVTLIGIHLKETYGNTASKVCTVENAVQH